MNPMNHWNPGWQFAMNAQQRAHAGGNRALQPAAPAPAPPAPLVPQLPARQPIGQGRRVAVAQQQQNAVPNPNPNPNRRNNRNQNNPVRREHQQVRQERHLSRDDVERLQTISRKNQQTRTALEYDSREDQCWTDLMNTLNTQSHQFTPSTPNGGPDALIPNDQEICSSLRTENQYETILKTRELLVNFGATEYDLSRALNSLEMHMRTNACEFNEIEDVSSDLMRTAGKLSHEIEELEQILRRIDNIKLQ
ncbi:unnamed protein product [Caenorhabditis sp. 36 PRJEB53466]|nr:unnamed protein product [Caenorhabditis sp. 36 PRJEB53466]